MVSENSTADDIEKGSDSDIAILPVGSTEQHGPHLPVSTDFLIAGAYAKRIGEELNAYVLPAIPISTCREHMGKRGSVWINPDTLYHVIQDIVLSLKEQGFRYIVVLIAHGGIFVAGPAVRELNAKNPDMKVIKLDITQYGKELESENIVEGTNNLHACEVETSLMMYLRPELVRKELIMDYVPDVPRDYLNYKSMLCYTESGVWGKPSLASPEKGKKIIEFVVSRSAEYINEVIEKTGGAYAG